MDQDVRLSEIRECFEHAADLPIEARSAFLEKACGSEAMRVRVQRMLDIHERGDGWLGKITCAAPNVADRASSRPAEMPERLGRYELTRQIAEGGMGVVFEALQDRPRRRVALKVLRNGFGSDRAARRFEYEAEILGQLRHPAIAQVYESNVWEGPWGRVPYFAMEYVEGARTITHYAKERELDLAQRLALFVTVCEAVQHGHQRGVIHRDLKPDNILVNDAGQVKIIDFGIARTADRDRGVTNTQPGQLLGTLHYMSPEQCRGDEVDTRADVYSLGMVLYECVTGCPPYPDESFERTLTRILTEAPPPPRSVVSTIPRDVQVVVQKAIDRDMARRYQSAAELADDVLALLEHRPIRARPASVVRRLQKWARRNRTLAASIASVMLLGSMALSARAIVRWQARSDALAEVSTIIVQRSEFLDLRDWRYHRLNALKSNREAKYIPPETDEEIARMERDVEEATVQHARDFSRAFELLARASRLGASERDVQRLRAELYHTEYRQARAELNTAASEAYLDLIRQSDLDGAVQTQLRKAQSISFTTSPPGASVFLFRLRLASDLSEAGERRHVPVPIGTGTLPVPAGSWSLHVVEGGDNVRAGEEIISIADAPVRGSIFVSNVNDHVGRFARLVSVDGEEVADVFDVGRLLSGHDEVESERRTTHRFEFAEAGRRTSMTGESLRQLGIVLVSPRQLAEIGGARATVWANGAIRSIAALPAGLEVRVHAAPLFVGPDASIGVTPIEDYGVVEGLCVFLVRAPGYEDVAFRWAARNQHTPVHFRLCRSSVAPDGFVHVVRFSDSNPIEFPTADDFWIMEREVTFAEYLEFLNDPLVRSQSEGDDVSMRVPRGDGQRYVTETSGRTLAPRSDIQSDWPVFGVSWYDAKAYADWKTACARRDGLPYTFDLPSESEWLFAGLMVHRSGRFVFGNYFQPKWFKCAVSRPLNPQPEPPMSFPIDQTVLGVFDMSGSVSEWLDSQYQGYEDRKYVKGGSWADGGPETIFGQVGGFGREPDYASNQVGFRLVCRIDDDALPAQ